MSLPLLITLLGGSVSSFTQFGYVTRLIDPADFQGASFYLEAVLKTSDATYPARARAFNVTDVVELPEYAESSSITPERVRSAAISPATGAKEYRFDFGGEPGADYTCYDQAIVVEFP